MKCVVSNCKNDSRRSSKSQGVTFHSFPNEPVLRKAWLKALDKEGWAPKERSAVCSEHFLVEDLYVTKSGLRKVKAGAVPFALEDSTNIDYGEPTSLRVCRVCLAMDAKLIPMRVYKLLEQAYEGLTGFMLRDEDRLPQKVCVECAQRLLSSSRFRHKCLRSNNLMLELLRRYDTLTIQNIQTINRENNFLISSLSVKHFDPDYHDIYIEYAEPPPPMVEQKEEPQLPQIKEEDEECDDIKNGANDEYKMSDRDYSSDDSLPLQICKKKTRKKKLEKTGKRKLEKSGKKAKAVEPKIDRRRKPLLNEDLNETLFTITDLSFEEQVAEILKRQDTPNYKNAEFKCNKCYKGFLDEDAYNGHMNRHTDQCGQHECGVCLARFRQAHALRKHATAHHAQRFSCRQCPYVTTHRQTARLHERWHRGTRYTCPHCDDEFAKFTTYMGHIRIKHPSDFVCELCGYSFVSVKGIELHKKLKHRLDEAQIPEDGPHCELCNVRFVSEDAYKQHLRVSARHSSQDKLDMQPSKPRKGRKRASETQAGASETDADGDVCRKAEGPIPCEQCGLQLEDSRAYHGHFRRAHPDKNRTNYPSMKSPCMCEVCGRMFQSQALLKDHRWVHTGERPFACEACGKAFRMRQRLVAHRRLHSAPRASYACALCGKLFSTHSNRQRHMFIHTGLKPFKCEMCGKGFKHASEKRAHITYVHLKKPWPKRARAKRRADNRPGLMPPPQGPELDLAAPLWPACDPKMDQVNMYSVR